MPRIGNVEVSDDVLASLSRTPQRQAGAMEVLAAAAEDTYGDLRYGLPYAAAKLQGNLSREDEAYYQRGLARTGAAAEKAVPIGLSGALESPIGFLATNIASFLPRMVGAVAGGAGGFAVAGPAGIVPGAAVGGIPQFLGSNVSRAVDEEGGLSQAAAERSLAVAPFQSAADATVAKFLPKGAASAVLSGGFLKRTAKAMAAAGATEAVTEAGQQVGERYAAGLPVGTPDAAAEYLNAAATAFVLGGVLGAGGGIRRSAATTKPASDVTNEDMVERIDGILNGTLRALPAPGQPGQLALPSPEAFGRTSSGPQIESVAPIVQNQRPTQLPTDWIVDPAGRAAPDTLEGMRGIVVDRNLPQPSAPPGPSLDEILAQLSPGVPEGVAARTALPAFDPANLQAPQTDTSVGTLTSVPGGQQTDLDLPASPRLFANVDMEDLLKASRAKGGDPAVVNEIQLELEARRSEALGGAALTTNDYQQRVDELKTGLRGGWVQNLTAENPQDLIDKTYTELFDNANTASNVRKFAQRVGLLDENMEPTEVATRIEAERAAANIQQAEQAAAPPPPPPVNVPDTSPATAADREQVDKAKSELGIQRLTGAKGVQTVADVFRALGDDPKAAARSGEATQVEKLARKLGLITDDDAMDVTPKGREVFLSTPEGLEETVAAAQQQGFVGKQASLFDRGVKAQMSGQEETTFSDFGDMAAYQAGKVWAQDFIANGDVRTAAQTEAIRSRQAGRSTVRGDAAPRIQLTPAQIQTQTANRLIDAADLTAASDTDVAMLRQMARNGAPLAEIEQTLRQVQNGELQFREVPRAFAPEVSTPNVGRGQPRFKEMYDPTEGGPKKAEQRVETETAVEAFELRNLIEFAKLEGGLTEARAAKLHELLDSGKTSQVKSALKAFDPDAAPRTQQTATRARLPKPPETVYEHDPEGRITGGHNAALEQALTGKSFDEVLDHLVEQAPSRYYREIMRATQKLATRLQKAGVELNFQIVRPGDTVPMALNSPSIRALARLERVPPRSTVYVKGSEIGPTSAGVNYQIIAHEMLHATTNMLVSWGSKNPDSALGKTVKDLLDLMSSVAAHYSERIAAGTANDFEKRFYNNEHNAFANERELISWGLTNPDMQRYLQSIEYEPRQSVFGKFVDLLRKLLGLEGSYNTALTELLRVSERITKTGTRDITAAYAMDDVNGFDNTVLEAPAQDAADISAANRTAQAANEVTKNVAETLGGFADKLNVRDYGVRARRTMLGWISHNQIDRQYGAEIPAVLEHSSAHRQRTAIRSRFEQMGESAYQNFERLEKANPKQAERVGQLMATTTEFQMDPDKTWDEHTWLKAEADADGNVKPEDAAREAQMVKLFEEVRKLANDLKRGDGAGWAMFNEFRQLNEAQNYARMAVGLHGLVATDRELSLAIPNSWENPADQFMRISDLSDPKQVRDHWEAALDAQLKAAMDFTRAKKGEAEQGTESDQRAMRQHLSPVDMQIAAIIEAKRGMAKGPYFHLGRFGDNFGSAVIAKGEDGRVDPKAQRAVAEALEKAGFTGAQISADNTRPRISLRFDKVDQAIQFRKLALELQQQGLLADEEIKVGPRNQADNFGVSEGLPQFVEAYIQSLEASPMFATDRSMDPRDRAAIEKLKDETIQLARDTWLESQPDSSISKVLTKRNTVAGYDKNMIRSWAHRWRVGSINIANVASVPKFNSAFTNMQAQYNDTLVANRRDENGELIKPGDPFLVQDVTRELKLRDAKNPINETADTFDKLRGIAHSYFLGFSPAYGMINMTQLGVTALPEMAKKHGYSKSFHAMRRASGQALSIVKAVASEGRKLGWRHWGDVALTDSVLKASNLDEQTRGFITHMIATGTIDIGSMARQLGQIADDSGAGGNLDTYLKLSSGIGLYTETFSRLVTALAARDLHGGYGADAQAYATKTVSESMFDYQNWNTARQLGKKGFLGPVTPLLTQFMSYSVQITEKLFSEAMDAFAKPRPGESVEAAAQRRRESRTFLMGHLTAVTTLAGSLGLPFATVFATVIERLVDAFDDDDEPFDATASYRNFLASVMGKEVAEVVARGAPRALGFDISQRAGEQNLMPFSEFFADRRSWKDAVGNSAGRSLGAVPSMLINVLDGGSKIAQGDVIGGMKDALPIAFKGPTEVYRMSSDGYVDSRGNKLPMSPTASSYLWQLLGFSPAEKAEYGEARGDQSARRGEITRRARVLRNGIFSAMEQGDRDRAAELLAEAREFDADNEAFAILPGLADAFARRQQTQIQSQATQTPVGVSLRDMDGQRMTGYANVNYGR